MIPIPNYLKTIINLTLYHCADPSIKPHRDKICDLAEKILGHPESAKEEDLIELAQQLHFIPSKEIKTDFKNKLNKVTSGILHAKNPIFTKIQPRWNEFWKDYNHIIKKFPIKDQDPQLLNSLTTTLLKLKTDQKDFLIKVLLSAPENERKKVFFNFLNLLQTEKDGNDLLGLLMGIPEDEQIIAFQAIENLLKNAKTPSDKKILVEIVTKLSKRDKTKIVDLVDHYPIVNLNAEKKMLILMGVFLYPNLSAIEKMDKFSKAKIGTLSDLIKVRHGSDKGFEIIKDAKFFIENETTPSQAAEALSAIEFFPKADKDYIFQITENILKTSKASILSLMKIYGKEAPSILRDSLPFIKTGMSSFEIGEVLSLMASIPKEKRTLIIEGTSSLLNETVHWLDPLIVIYILTKTPNALREETLKKVLGELPLETPFMSKLFHYLKIACAKRIEISNRPLMKQYRESPIEDTFEDIAIESIIPIPSHSLFANSNLLVFSNDVKDEQIPLNGIRKREFEEIEQLAKDIFSGNAKIAIDSKDSQFQSDVQKYILTLLTRPLGRKLIKKIVDNKSVSSLSINPGRKSTLHIPLDKNIQSKMSIDLTPKSQQNLQKGFGPNGEIITYLLPHFLALGHELIHVSHFPEIIKRVGIKDPVYDNREEKITISGTEKDLDSLDVFEKDFDLLNERNLNAQFADTTHVLYPRFDHKGLLENVAPTNPFPESYKQLEQAIHSILWNASTPNGIFNLLLAQMRG